ncbi:unnamed protein product [Schistosoma rodhaini]|uniref:Uncharacterized protein n=1 Tax=Schistosoma rodhaini TaxID=6188 RepID=A0AA85G1X5_9TREM|nr:unnamed protein product [Schistosoma rodhaini]CAH8594463.1 unnamed protein product [Schistosoma rodhaini]
MENVSMDNKLKMINTNNIHNNMTTSIQQVMETTENNNIISTNALWTEKEQRVTVIIVVALVTIITICVILIILRTLRKKSNKKSSGIPIKNQKKTSQSNKINKVEERENYSCILNDNFSEPKWIMQQQSTVGRTSDRIRKVPTRNPENKKWYDSAAIPFMDDVHSSMDNLHTDQRKNQQI